MLQAQDVRVELSDGWLELNLDLEEGANLDAAAASLLNPIWPGWEDCLG